jgi:hypothetical protein
MSKKDLLKEKAKAKLATSVTVKAEVVNLPVVSGGELKAITMEIKASLEEIQDVADWWKEKKIRINELKEVVIEKLIYVRDNRKSLLGGRTFEDYLVNEIGLSKGYFYEQLQAYEVCVEYKKPKLFKEVDHKILVNIAREKDPDKKKVLFDNAKDLSREDFKKEKQDAKVSPPDFSVKQNVTKSHMNQGFSRQTPASIAVNLINSFNTMMAQEKKDDSKDAIRNMINGILTYSKLLNDERFISDEELNDIEKLIK